MQGYAICGTEDRKDTRVSFVSHGTSEMREQDEVEADNHAYTKSSLANTDSFFRISSTPSGGISK